MSVTVKVLDAKTAIASHKVPANGTLVLDAQKNVNYQLIDETTGFGPQNIIASRDGNDLVIRLEKDNKNIAFTKDSDVEPSIIIKDYYLNNDNMIIGLHENGNLYAYVPESGVATDSISVLAQEVTAAQALGGESLVVPFWAFNPWWLAGFAGVAAIAAIAASSGGSKGGSAAADTTAPDAPIVESLSASLSGNTVISGQAEAGSIVYVEDETGAIIGSGVADANGSYTIETSRPIQATETLKLHAKDKAGNASNKTPVSSTIQEVNEQINEPVITKIRSNVDAENNTVSSTVEGHTTPNRVVQIIDKTTGKVVGSGVSDANGNFTIVTNEPLTEGSNYDVVTVSPLGKASPPKNVVGDDKTSIDITVTGNDDGTATAKLKGEPGATVNGKFPSGEAFTVTLDKNGEATVTSTTQQPSDKDIIVTSVDGMGNVAVGNKPYIDETGPKRPTVAIENNFDDNGAVAGHKVSGKTEPNATVTLLDKDNNPVLDASGNPITTIAKPNGEYSFDNVPPQAHGTLFNVIAKDPAGNPSLPGKDNVDTTPPAAPTVDAVINSPQEEGKEQTSTIYGKAGKGQKEGDVVEIYELDPITGEPTGEPIATAIVEKKIGEDGQVELVYQAGPLPLMVTGDKLGVVGLDSAGNSSKHNVAEGDNSVKAPTLTVINNPDGTLTATGQAEPFANVEVEFPDGSKKVVPADENGNYTVTSDNPQQAGEENKISATQTDPSGNVSEPAVKPFTEDNQPPVVELDTTKNGKDENGNPTLTVSGKTEPNATVTLLDKDNKPVLDASGNPITTTADPEGNFTFPAVPAEDSEDNPIDYNVSATDTNGNPSEPIPVVVDKETVAPQIEVSVNEDGTLTVTQKEGTTVEPNATVELKFPDGTTQTVKANEEGKFEPVTSEKPQTPGTKEVTATATDEAGNSAEGVDDAVIPVLPPEVVEQNAIDKDGDGNPDTNEIKVKAQPNTPVVITDENGEIIGSGTTDENGDLTIETDRPLTEGEKVTVTAKDPEDPTKGESTEIITDTTPPEEPSIQIVQNPDGTVSVIAGNDPSKNEPGATIEVTFPDGTTGSATVKDDGTFDPITSEQPQKNGEVSATQIDEANNPSNPVTETYTDTTPPALTVTEVKNNLDGFNDPITTTVSGKTEPNAFVELKDKAGNLLGTTTADSEGNFSITTTEAFGPLLDKVEYDVFATDINNVPVEKPELAVGDLQVPQMPIVDIEQIQEGEDKGKAKVSPNPNETYKDGDIIEVTFPDGTTGSAVVENGTFEPIVSEKPQDSGDVEAVAVAPNGRRSDKTIEPMQDTVNPDAPVVTDIDNNDNGTTTISGTAEPRSIVKLYDPEDPTKVIGSVQTNDDGTFSLVVPTLQETEEPYKLTATDTSGNESDSKNVEGDTTVPVVTVESMTNITDENDKPVSKVTGKVDGVPAGTLVEITDPATNQVIGSAVTKDDEGNFEIITDKRLENGVTYPVSATDEHGNKGSDDALGDQTEPKDLGDVTAKTKEVKEEGKEPTKATGLTIDAPEQDPNDPTQDDVVALKIYPVDPKTGEPDLSQEPITVPAKVENGQLVADVVPQLDSGDYVAIPVDAAGNEGPQKPFTVDSTPPAPPVKTEVVNNDVDGNDGFKVGTKDTSTVKVTLPLDATKVPEGTEIAEVGDVVTITVPAANEGEVPTVVKHTLTQADIDKGYVEMTTPLLADKQEVPVTITDPSNNVSDETPAVGDLTPPADIGTVTPKTAEVPVLAQDGKPVVNPETNEPQTQKATELEIPNLPNDVVELKIYPVDPTTGKPDLTKDPVIVPIDPTTGEPETVVPQLDSGDYVAIPVDAAGNEGAEKPFTVDSTPPAPPVKTEVVNNDVDGKDGFKVGTADTSTVKVTLPLDATKVPEGTDIAKVGDVVTITVPAANEGEQPTVVKHTLTEADINKGYVEMTTPLLADEQEVPVTITDPSNNVSNETPAIGDLTPPADIDGVKANTKEVPVLNDGEPVNDPATGKPQTQKATGLTIEQPKGENDQPLEENPLEEIVALKIQPINPDTKEPIGDPITVPAKVDENGNLVAEVVPQLEDGTYTATPIDAAGNEGTTPSEFVVDATPTAAPKIQGFTNTPDGNDEDTLPDSSKVIVELPKDIEVGDTVQIRDEAGKVVGTHVVTEDDLKDDPENPDAPKTVTVEVEPALTNGKDYTATVEDKAGNVSEPSDKITGDTLPPAPPAVSIKNNDNDSTKGFQLGGEDTTTIKVTLPLDAAKVPEGTDIAKVGDVVTITIPATDTQPEQVYTLSPLTEEDIKNGYVTQAVPLLANEQPFNATITDSRGNVSSEALGNGDLTAPQIESVTPKIQTKPVLDDKGEPVIDSNTNKPKEEKLTELEVPNLPDDVVELKVYPADPKTGEPDLTKEPVTVPIDPKTGKPVPTALPDGQYVAIPVDEAGNEGDPKPFEVDTTPTAAPKIQGFTNTPDGNDEDTLPDSSKVIVELPEDVKVDDTVQIRDEAGNVVGTHVVTEDDLKDDPENPDAPKTVTVEVKPALTNGKDYTATVEDKAGNVSEKSESVTGDTEGPDAPTISAMNAGSTFNDDGNPTTTLVTVDLPQDEYLYDPEDPDAEPKLIKEAKKAEVGDVLTLLNQDGTPVTTVKLDEYGEPVLKDGEPVMEPVTKVITEDDILNGQVYFEVSPSLENAARYKAKLEDPIGNGTESELEKYNLNEPATISLNSGEAGTVDITPHTLNDEVVVTYRDETDIKHDVPTTTEGVERTITIVKDKGAGSWHVKDDEALPEGVSLDPATGKLTFKPNAILDGSDIQITANRQGSDSVSTLKEENQHFKAPADDQDSNDHGWYVFSNDYSYRRTVGGGNANWKSGKEGDLFIEGRANNEHLIVEYVDNNGKPQTLELIRGTNGEDTDNTSHTGVLANWKFKDGSSVPNSGTTATDWVIKFAEGVRVSEERFILNGTQIKDGSHVKVWEGSSRPGQDIFISGVRDAAKSEARVTTDISDLNEVTLEVKPDAVESQWNSWAIAPKTVVPQPADISRLQSDSNGEQGGGARVEFNNEKHDKLEVSFSYEQQKWADHGDETKLVDIPVTLIVEKEGENWVVKGLKKVTDATEAEEWIIEGEVEGVTIKPIPAGALVWIDPNNSGLEAKFGEVTFKNDMWLEIAPNLINGTKPISVTPYYGEYALIGDTQNENALDLAVSNNAWTLATADNGVSISGVESNTADLIVEYTDTIGALTAITLTRSNGAGSTWNVKSKQTISSDAQGNDVITDVALGDNPWGDHFIGDDPQNFVLNADVTSGSSNVTAYATNYLGKDQASNTVAAPLKADTPVVTPQPDGSVIIAAGANNTKLTISFVDETNNAAGSKARGAEGLPGRIVEIEETDGKRIELKETENGTYVEVNTDADGKNPYVATVVESNKVTVVLEKDTSGNWNLSSVSAITPEGTAVAKTKLEDVGITNNQDGTFTIERNSVMGKTPVTAEGEISGLTAQASDDAKEDPKTEKPVAYIETVGELNAEMRALIHDTYGIHDNQLVINPNNTNKQGTYNNFIIYYNDEKGNEYRIAFVLDSNGDWAYNHVDGTSLVLGQQPKNAGYFTVGDMIVLPDYLVQNIDPNSTISLFTADFNAGGQWQLLDTYTGFNVTKSVDTSNFGTISKGKYFSGEGKWNSNYLTDALDPAAKNAELQGKDGYIVDLSDDNRDTGITWLEWSLLEQSYNQFKDGKILIKGDAEDGVNLGSGDEYPQGEGNNNVDFSYSYGSHKGTWTKSNEVIKVLNEDYVRYDYSGTQGTAYVYIQEGVQVY